LKIQRDAKSSVFSYLCSSTRPSTFWSRAESNLFLKKKKKKKRKEKKRKKILRARGVAQVVKHLSSRASMRP
jgi:hypothetical protein